MTVSTDLETIHSEFAGTARLRSGSDPPTNSISMNIYPFVIHQVQGQRAAQRCSFAKFDIPRSHGATAIQATTARGSIRTHINAVIQECSPVDM